MTINDRNWKFLHDATGLSLTYNDMYYRYLRGLGFTGTLQQMIAKSKRGMNAVIGSGNPANNTQPWTPSRLGSKLLVDWNPDVPSSIVVTGTGVSSWIDQKSNYTPVQAVDASRPTYSLTGFNNKPGLSFNGTSHELTLAPSPMPSGSTPCEVWSVVQQNALAGEATSRAIMGWGSTTGGQRRQVGRSVVSGVNRARAIGGAGGVNISLDGTNVDFSSRHVVRVRYASDLLSMWVDGINEGSAAMALADTVNDRVRIGSSPGAAASNYWNGGVRRIIVTSLLSVDEATSLQTYMLALR